MARQANIQRSINEVASIPFWMKSFISPFEVSPGIDQRTLIYKESKVNELIGEGALDVTETLRKGEFDGEYTLRPTLG